MDFLGTAREAHCPISKLEHGQIPLTRQTPAAATLFNIHATLNPFMEMQGKSSDLSADAHEYHPQIPFVVPKKLSFKGNMHKGSVIKGHFHGFNIMQASTTYS